MKTAAERLRRVIPRVAEHVRRRTEEFRTLGREGETLFDFRPFVDLVFETDLFSELCFCLLTANSSALMGLRIQASAGRGGFLKMDYEDLVALLSRHGHRFPEQRASRILKARERWESIEELLRSGESSPRLRELLADPRSEFKVEGLGYKEASHFLRNVGRPDVAIIDRHVHRFLLENGLYPQIKTLTPKRYREMESILGRLASNLDLTLGELDLYIFYVKTGRILK